MPYHVANNREHIKHELKRELKHVIIDTYYYMSDLYEYNDTSIKSIELYEDFTYDYDADYKDI